MAGVYVHIPFCKRKCRYCDFYSVTDLTLIPAYIEAVKRQAAAFGGETADSVYFGGGTPSLLSGAQISTLLDCFRQTFQVSEDCEITIEVNPESCGGDNLPAYRNAGINRVSIGIQSASGETLSKLGRLHGAAEAKAALEIAVKAGFSNISADLMLALPGEGEKEISDSIELLTESGAAHISAYLLKISRGTPFFRDPPDGLPDDDRAAELYRFAAGELERRGYCRYEISNFAKSGYQSRHNLKYWNCEDYIGLGAAAHSSVSSIRYSCAPSVKEYIGTFVGVSGDWRRGLRIEGEADWKDYVMLGLRTTKGLSEKALCERFGFSFNAAAKKLISRYEDAGFLSAARGLIRLTLDGLLVSNSIIAGLLAAAEQN